MTATLEQRPYTLATTVDADQETAIAEVTEALKAEGFGVLTTIDVQATLREKIGAEVEPYVILGACNPHLAHQGLAAEPDLGALLPCNVIVYQRDGVTNVAAMDPGAALGVVGNDAIGPIADEAQERLTRALSALTS